MKNQEVVIQNLDAQRGQKFREAAEILLAMFILGLGIAGFLVFFKMQDSHHKDDFTTLHYHSLIEKVFPEVKFTCSPGAALPVDLKSATKYRKQDILWSGLCRSFDDQQQFQLQVSMKISPKIFKGVKVGKEIFYLSVNNGAQLLSGNYKASGFSSYFIAGITSIRGVHSTDKSVKVKLTGIGVGFGLLVDRYLSLQINEVKTYLTATK